MNKLDGMKYKEEENEWKIPNIPSIPPSKPSGAPKSQEPERILALDYLYDMENFVDRFKFHFSKVNPKYYFISKERILEA